MAKSAFSILIVLFPVSVPALGGAIVELIPDKPGPYAGGETLALDVWLHSNEPFNWLLRYVRLDFEDSSSALDIGDTFSFDFSAVPSGGNGYFAFTFPELPRPSTFMSFDCLCPSYYFPLLSGGSLHLGTIDATLPSTPGQYFIDALNVDNSNSKAGARIDPYTEISLSPEKPWTAFGGDLIGGTYEFLVVPEPSCLTLFLLVYLGSAPVRRRLTLR